MLVVGDGAALLVEIAVDRAMIDSVGLGAARAVDMDVLLPLICRIVAAG